MTPKKKRKKIKANVSLMYKTIDNGLNIYSNILRRLSISGGYFDKIRIDYDTKAPLSNRSLISNKHIYKDEVIISIPISTIITYEHVISSDIGRVFTDNIKESTLYSPKHSTFATFLLLERKFNKQSTFTDYYNILPTTYYNFPVFYNEEQLMWLKGTKFLDFINRIKLEMLHDYEVICEKLVDFSKEFSFKCFCEARVLISSRLFKLKVKKDLYTDALIPMADLLNHNDKCQTIWYYNEITRSFIVKATQEINEGKEIFDSYGKKTNYTYLMNYGFIVENNEVYEEYPLTIPIICNKDINCSKLSLLSISNYSLDNHTFNISLDLTSTYVTDLFSYLRFMELSNEEFEGYFSTYYPNNKYSDNDIYQMIYDILPINKINERKVLTSLKKIIVSELNRYPYDYKGDIKYCKCYKSINDNTTSFYISSYIEKCCYHIRTSEMNI